jgi:tRNA nucleotidyltransferase/poly(A) polymerase
MYKSAATGAMPQIQLNNTEEMIFKFLQDACVSIGAVKGVQPTVRVAGGWVRDKLLGVQSKDIDITVDTIRAEEFADKLYDISNLRTETTGFVSEPTYNKSDEAKERNIDTVILKINGQEIDLLPLRVEYYEPYSRHPLTVDFQELSTIAQTEGIPRYLKKKRPDLFEKLSELPPAGRNDPAQVLPLVDTYRRDLTINAIFYNLATQQVEDKTGRGIDDLEKMHLTTPLESNMTFKNDPLRVLRVLRFYSRYADSKIDPDVVKAMADPTIQKQIVRRIQGDNESGISGENIATELRKLFMGNKPEEALRTMYNTGLLQKMLLLPPEYNPLEMDQKNKHHALNVIEHTLAVVKNVNELSKEFGLGNKQRMMMNFTSLFHDLGKLDSRSHKNKEDGSRGYSGDPDVPGSLSHQQASQDQWKIFSDALNMSDEEKDTISELIVNHMNPHGHIEGQDQSPTDSVLRKYIRKNPSWVFQYIHAMADAMSKGEVPNPAATDPYRANLDRLHQLAPTADSFGNSVPIIELVKGQEIIQIVGLPPQPPPGMNGYINIVKETILEAQDTNPEMQKPDAILIIQNMANMGRAGQGVLAPYFQSAV